MIHSIDRDFCDVRTLIASRFSFIQTVCAAAVFSLFLLHHPEKMKYPKKKRNSKRKQFCYAYYYIIIVLWQMHNILSFFVKTKRVRSSISIVPCAIILHFCFISTLRSLFKNCSNFIYCKWMLNDYSTQSRAKHSTHTRPQSYTIQKHRVRAHRTWCVEQVPL